MPATRPTKSKLRPTSPTLAMRKRKPTQFQTSGQTPIVEPGESDPPLPLQPTAATTHWQLPQKRGRKRKVTTGDAETELSPSKKAKTRSTVKAALPNRDALPGPRDHRAMPSTWRTSKQVAAERTAVQKVAEDEVKRDILKPSEQTVKELLALRAESPSATHQESHPGVAGAPAELVTSLSDRSDIHTSVSMFSGASNFVVRGGNFYCVGRDLYMAPQDFNRTPKGIVKGVEVFTGEDVHLKEDIYKGRGYRIYSAHSTTRARTVKIKLYEGSRAKERCSAAAKFNRKPMNLYIPHLIGVSPLNSELAFLVFHNDTEWGVESMIASALSKGLKPSLHVGLQTVVGLSLGLDYLRIQQFPFESVGLDHFFVNRSRDGKILIGFDLEVLPDETKGQDQCSSASYGGNELNVFHGLCRKTFDAASKAHYEFQRIQRNYVDELDASHSVSQDQFEELLFAMEIDGLTPDVLNPAPSDPQSRKPPLKSTPRAPRRELVWKSQELDMVSLEDIARQFEGLLLPSSTELVFNRRRGRYTTKTAHRCPGYNRIEITLTTDITQSAIVSHLTPTPHEICPVCKEVVKDAEIFSCLCGGEDNESIPTIRCSTCSEWHHRPCVNIYEGDDRSFVCQHCDVQMSLLEPNQSDLYLPSRSEDTIMRAEDLSGVASMSASPTSPPTSPQVPDSTIAYVTAIKTQLQDKPGALARFDDIMSIFEKSDLSMLGLMDHISELFTGHPALLQGFNKFLPDGYRFEFSTDHNGSSVVALVTPLGRTIKSTNVTVDSQQDWLGGRLIWD